MKLIVLILIILSYSYFPTIIGKRMWKGGFKVRERNEIMLTFDDGPDSKYTEELLNLLKRENIRASFFMVSEFARNNKELVERVENEGHTIGVHSRNHKPILYRGYKYTRDDFKKSLEYMEELGINVKYYRPPWGQVNLFSYGLLRKYKLKKILWNVMAEDWSAGVTSNEIESKLLSRVREGSIICLHDGRGEEDAPARMLEALEVVIPKLKEEGYKFITVGDYYG